MKKAVVGVIMGSQSDWPTMEKACEILAQLRIPYEVEVVSAHRTPVRMHDYAESAEDRGLKVIIAGAGGAAHLPGMVSGQTTLPVLGVPIQSRALQGLDSLLSIVQMPKGVPTATFSIGEAGATNAALFAARILALGDVDLKVNLHRYINKQTGSVSSVIKQDLIVEGKTKRVFKTPGFGGLCLVESKDDITAGDGARHDVIEGKGVLANETTCNVFETLLAEEVPLAFIRRVDDTHFLARHCSMIPIEYVVRREAHGSYIKRHPVVTKGTRFDPLVHELFLKTKGRRWMDRDLPIDDPLMILKGRSFEVFLPHEPLAIQQAFMSIIPTSEFHTRDIEGMLAQMRRIAEEAFLIIEKAWGKNGGRLVDWKVEFGYTDDGKLVIADVIDSDSWRVLMGGDHVDKQIYREGATVEETVAVYRGVAMITGKFCQR